MPDYNPTETFVTPNPATPAFAHYLAGLTRAKITGVFVERNAGQLVMVMKNMDQFPDPHKHKVRLVTATKCCGKCANNAAAITGGLRCKEDNIEAEANSFAADIQVEKVVSESRFADLIVLDAKMSFDAEHKKMLSDFTKAVLSRSECPVIIAPYAFHGIEEIIFAYDGSSSAVFAIKQFSHLFPSLAEKKLTVLQINCTGDAPVKHKEEIGALLQLQYSNIGFDSITGEPSNALHAYLLQKTAAIVVMGAFGENIFASTSRPSTAEPLIKTSTLPLFIAHH
ncbi:MAG: universal stress protein [Chitinophagaceae bacterium]